MAHLPPPVLVIGVGDFADAVVREIETGGSTPLLTHRLDPRQASPDNGCLARVRELSKAVSAVVSCDDSQESLSTAVADVCADRVPLIACALNQTGAIVQIVLPRSQIAGCPACRELARRWREGEVRPVPQHDHRERDRAAAAMMVNLAVREAIAAFRDGRAADSRAHLVNFADRTAHARVTSRHFACTRCWPRPLLTGDALRDQVQCQWRAAWDTPNPPADLVSLARRLERLVDSYSGPFDHVWSSSAIDRRAIAEFCYRRDVRPNQTPFVVAERALVTRRRENASREPVLSEGFDFSDPDAAKALALVEGLERLFALDFIDRSHIVRATHDDVAGFAIDPRALPLFSDVQYRTPAFPFRRFESHREMNWLWGLNIANGEPVLVPADVVEGRPQAGLMQATSNGAACHSSLHHAVLNGLYELIERDALMATWLNQWSRPRVDVFDTDPDPNGVRKAFEHLSFRLTQVDVTTRVGIPVLMAVLEDMRNPDFFMSTMVAGLSRTRLQEKLYRELSQFTYPYLVNPAHYQTPVSWSDDPAHVRTLPDHLSFYQDRKKRPLTEFLSASTRTCHLSHIADEECESVEEEIRVVVQRLVQAGYDAIAIDCTPPLLREIGMWVVKVVVPGLEPLTVGHGCVPLGGRPVAAAVNPWPHPFW